MNGYRDQRSRQSGRSSSIRGAGRTVQSVPPSAAEKTGRSRTFPSTPKRATVQPSVCGVQPGKVLELRTTLGLMRARAILDQQIELERQQITEEGQMEGNGEQRENMTSGRLKHGRLQPLGLVSDPMIASNSCLGIVSVSGQSPRDNRRPRSCTEPGGLLSGTQTVTQDQRYGGGAGKGAKVKRRSYSAVLQHDNVPVGRLKELASNLSVSQQTGLIPEGKSLIGGRTTNLIKTGNNGSRNQKLTDTTPIATEVPHRTEGAQKFSDVQEDLQATDTTADADASKIQILPPVVRFGELGMRVEVTRLRAAKSSGIRNSVNSRKSSTTTSTVELKEQNRTMNEVLPSIGHREKNETDNSRYLLSQNQATRTETSEERCDQKDKANSHDTLSRSTPTSPVKVSIVSLGETPGIRPESQQSGRHQQRRRRRRHSEGRQLGVGRLSQGWSPPRDIEALVGSPLHTPRRQSRSTTPRGGRSHVTKASTNEEQSINELDTRRSLMTSPGLMINIDVNEFLRDADDPV